MQKSRTLKQKIDYRMARRPSDDVFLPREFTDLSGEDQVLRARRMLVKEGRLMRLGYGVYARAMRSRLSGRPMAAAMERVALVATKHGAARREPHDLPWSKPRRRALPARTPAVRRQQSGPLPPVDQPTR